MCTREGGRVPDDVHAAFARELSEGAALSDVLGRPDTFVWIGLYEPNETLLRKIQEEFGLHDLDIEDALSAHQRP